MSFSVIASVTANPSEDLLMEMVSKIDVAGGRPSSDLIDAMSAVMGLRAGWRTFVVVLLDGTPDDEAVWSW